ncbi:MAG: hypothetical protein ACM3WU_03865 [Bacillota bacterium]
MRNLLSRPVPVKNLLIAGYVVCLYVLTAIRLTRESMEPVFFAGLFLGMGSVSAMVFSPGSKKAGSKSAALLFTLLMHGLLAVTSIINSNYYPGLLIGRYFGYAIPYSAAVVLLEWAAVVAIGKFFASHERPVLRLWAVAIALLCLTLVVAAPRAPGRGYRVVSGQPPARYYRFSEPIEQSKYMDAGEYGVAALDGVFVLLRTGWDRSKVAKFSVLRGIDTKSDKQWTVDMIPSTYWLHRAHLALRETDELLVVHETLHTNEVGDKAVWITEVDINSGTKSKPEFVVRAPWLGPDASAMLLSPEWQQAPLTHQSGLRIDVEEEQLLVMSGPGFRWELTGDPKVSCFFLSQDIVVMRELQDNETYDYHVFLLPSPQLK